MKKFFSSFTNAAGAAAIVAAVGATPVQAGGGFDLGDLGEGIGRGIARSIERNAVRTIDRGVEEAFGNDSASNRARRDQQRFDQGRDRNTLYSLDSFNNCSLTQTVDRRGRAGDSLLVCGRTSIELSENYGFGNVGRCDIVGDSRGRAKFAQCDRGTFEM